MTSVSKGKGCHRLSNSPANKTKESVLNETDVKNVHCSTVITLKKWRQPESSFSGWEYVHDVGYNGIL